MGQADTLDETPGSIIPIIIAVIVAFFVFIFLMYTMNNAINTITPEELKDLKGPNFINIIPVIIAGACIAIVLLFFPREEYTAEEIAEAKPIKNYTREERKTRKTALQIIRERYARGEITKEEYTEFMSRL